MSEMDAIDRESAGATEGPMHTFTVTEAEREVLVLALGELLQSTRRGEHLVPVIQALLRRLGSASVSREP